MTVANWPTTLPAPLAEGALQPAPVARRQAFDGRIARQIRKARNPSWRFDARWMLMPVEWDDFMHFVRFDASYGTNWFTAAWIDSLMGTSGYAARFADAPKFKRKGLLCEVSSPLEIQTTALALVPMGTDWPISNSSAAPTLPTDLMAFWWSAASEPTADGSTPPKLYSLHNSGDTYLNASAYVTMATVNGKRALKNINPYRANLSINRLANCAVRNFTLAAVVYHNLSTDVATFNFQPVNLAINKGSITVTNYGTGSLSPAYTAGVGGRTCVVLRCDYKGLIRLFANGNLLVESASSVNYVETTSDISLVLGSSSANSYSGYYHEFIEWHRALSNTEIGTVSNILMTNWGV